MTTPLVYPLEQIISVKIRRVEQQEKVVKLKKELLEKEKEKLIEREADRDKAKYHHHSKLLQLREEMDHDTTTEKITQMKNYLNVAKEKLAIEEKKVKDQMALVQQAKQALQVEVDLLKVKRQEVDKLKIHKKDWLAEAKKELEIVEGREQDELGSTTFLTNRLKRGRTKA